MVMTLDEKKRFQAMENQLDEIDGKVDEILTALKGDDLGQFPGVISEIKETKSRIRKLEIIKNKLIWLAMGAGIAAGFSIDKVWSFITKILMK